MYVKKSCIVPNLNCSDLNLFLRCKITTQLFEVDKAVKSSNKEDFIDRLDYYGLLIKNDE